MRRAVPEGIRITKVGLWYVLFAVVVGIAATNTGNNALYMVLAVMLAVLAVSGVVSRSNLRRLGMELEPPGDTYANTPFPLHFTLSNRSFFPRWLVLVSMKKDGVPALVSHLPAGGGFHGHLELMMRRRGRHHLAYAHLRSLFPLGFFRKGMRHRVDLDLLVYPEIYPAASCQLEQAGHFGQDPKKRPGWGHDLHSLRGFRPGDDPRRVHWKQSARTSSLIYKEHKAEESRRLSILLDNAVGELKDPTKEERFERLVSEAATATMDYLQRGYEVELRTRDRCVPFAGGEQQRHAILEALALVETRPLMRHPLPASDTHVPQLRLVLDGKPTLSVDSSLSQAAQVSS